LIACLSRKKVQCTNNKNVKHRLVWRSSISAFGIYMRKLLTPPTTILIFSVNIIGVLMVFSTFEHNSQFLPIETVIFFIYSRVHCAYCVYHNLVENNSGRTVTFKQHKMAYWTKSTCNRLIGSRIKLFNTTLYQFHCFCTWKRHNSGDKPPSHTFCIKLDYQRLRISMLYDLYCNINVFYLIYWQNRHY